MKLISVGDNVTDCYLDTHEYFPGGQAVNVAVNAKRDGAEEAAYLGVFGNDERAAYIKECLRAEGVSTERCRVACLPTARPGVHIVDGDRVFVHGPADSCPALVRMRLAQGDLDLIGRYDVCHTTNEADIDDQLSRINAVVPLSYDFSTDRDEAYLRTVCPNVSIAFLSGSGLSTDDADSLMRHVYEMGPKVVVMTLGERGSHCLYEDKTYVQDAVRVDAIDAMGAGDSFAAAFLVSFGKTRDAEEALAFAAQKAAHTCTLHGAFGYSHREEGRRDAQEV